MPATMLDIIQKTVDMQEKLAKITKLSSHVHTELISPNMTFWSNEAHKPHSSLQFVHDFKCLKFDDPYSNVFNSINSFSESSATIKVFKGAEDYINLKNRYLELDTISHLFQQQIQDRKKKEADILESLKKRESNYPYIVPAPPKQSTTVIGNTIIGTVDCKKSIDLLNELVRFELENFDSHIYKSTFLDWDYLHELYQLQAVRSEISEKQKIVNLIITIKKWLSSVFRRFQINRREFFRKINSFLFKNLDDYHSMSLTSVGY